jgi:hypothetical protein
MNFYMSFGLVNFAIHLQQATGPSFTTLQRKNKESSKQKGSYIIFKAKPECFQYLFFLHDLNGGKLNTPPPDPPQFAGAKVTSTQTTPSLNYRKTKSKNPTESEYPKPSEDDNNNNNNASKRLKD